MSKLALPNVIKGVQKSIVKHSPEILVGFGIAGMLTTTVLAVRATPKALELIEEKKADLEVEKLTPKEVIETTWKCYVPAIATGILSSACLIGSNSVNLRRNAALATAYTLSETALREYKDKVIETIGEKKEKAVRDAIAKDKIDRNPLSGNEVVITEKGDTLCYDAISGRYFKSDIDKLKRAENEINRRLLLDEYISLNEFYYEIGLSETKMGNDLGWNINKGLITFNFSSQLAEDGTPCLVLDFAVAPRYDYDR